MLRFALPMLMLAVSLASSAAAETPPAATATPQPAAPAPAAPFVRPPPPGKLIDIGGRRLHLFCKGDARGGPTVVFEAGLSQYAAWTTYTKAQDLIAPFARVCSYDRAGLGWSDPDPAPRTHLTMVSDLHRLLAKAKEHGPYILVGHSMGGLLVRLYAKTYPREVAGVVLADSTPRLSFTPDAVAERAATLAQIDAALKTSRPGQPVIPLPAGTSGDIILAYTPEIIAAVKGEYLAIEHTPDALRAPGGYGTLGNIPLVVIRRGLATTPPSAQDTEWRAAQETLPALSSNSQLVVAEHAGHVIPYDRPAVVAAAVRRVLDAHAGHAPLAAP